jgi:hypothetical protein
MAAFLKSLRLDSTASYAERRIAAARQRGAMPVRELAKLAVLHYRHLSPGRASLPAGFTH